MSFWRNYFHIVWTTEQRQPCIDDALEPQLYAQIVRQCADLACFVYTRYTTNAWLERAVEQDDGPTSNYAPATSPTPREEPVGYDVMGDFPF